MTLKVLTCYGQTLFCETASAACCARNILKQAWHTRTGLMMRRRRISVSYRLHLQNKHYHYQLNKRSISADYHPGLRIIKNDNILFQTFIFEFVKVYRLVYVNIVQMLYLPWTKHFSTITTVMLAFREWKSNGAGMALFHTIIFYPVIRDHTTRLICHGPVVHSTFVLSNKHCTMISMERVYTPVLSNLFLKI